MNKNIKYPCGCAFAWNSDNRSIVFDANIDNINLDCVKTWRLLSDGNTKGCFQLESRLGKSMAKKLKPQNIEQLSALISIMRPGCLEAVRDGKSVSNHYIDRKNGLESIDYFHPSLKDILSPTYGEMIYQEQTMEIAKTVAGFDLQEADMLRKAIGKKKPEDMAKIKEKFIAGCSEQKVVTIDQAAQIFGWIEKSQRYLFNKSHSISYAINAYLSAYTKTHFPQVFFASCLKFAKDKIDPHTEIKELVQNANEMDIIIHVPDLRLLNENFIIHNNAIYFGLTDIKGVGTSVFKKLVSVIDNQKLDTNTMSWYDCLLQILLNINSTAAKAIIECGAIDFFNKNRSDMLFEYNIANGLTNKEVQQILHIDGDFKHKLFRLIHYGKISKNRISIIQDYIDSINNPPHSLSDTPESISDAEACLLGCSITASRIEIYDISLSNTTCKEFKGGKQAKTMIIAGEIEHISVVKTKGGKNPGSNMAFITINDGTGCLDSVIFFPEQYQKYSNILFEQNIILIKGYRSKGSDDSFVVDKCYMAKP